MHFSKLITAIAVVAATGALASSHYHEEGHDLAGAPHELEGLEGGMGAGAFGEESEMEFSPVTETSLEASSTNRYCFFGRCLRRRRSWHRRCPRGFHAVGYRRCGWWRVRALCCRNRRLAQGQLEGEEFGAESSELGLDELDN